MGIVQFSIRNSLIVNLLLLVIVIAGVLSWRSMPQEMFPIVDLDLVRIVTEYEGAPPEEVEKQITILIEEEIETLPDVDVVTSESSEGLSKIEIKLKTDVDVDDFLREVRSVVDAIDDFPIQAETPEISRLKTRFPVISVTLYGSTELGVLYETAENVRRDLLGLQGVASVGIAGDQEWELWVIVDPHGMAARNVTLNEVQSALTENLQDLPGGSMQAAEGDILLRGMGVAPNAKAVGDLVLRSNAGGGQLTLSQIADIDLRLEEAQTIGRFNG
jgi:multidrug efflux pump subunit AcrB